ncbi:hypothetical protein PIB30_054307 [Stylosanthes scabra]|uniref:Uncharacterized protein n=1 Tax=Stylosanthes scabra TaxID=79078 RepID=A0ABU6QJG6_9FABA|nr:hypothetical protein [Stylosanthes scabra]
MARRKSRARIELGVQGFESTPHPKFPKLPRIESTLLVIESIRFHPVFKFNVQNALRIDSSSSESILKRRKLRSIGSSKCMWGSCFHVGQELTSWLTVAAGGPPASIPATNLGISH